MKKGIYIWALDSTSGHRWWRAYGAPRSVYNESIPAIFGWHCDFIDKSSTYTDVIYLQYFQDFERIHEYNWGVACLVYLYSKLSEGYKWKTKQVTSSITLLTVIFVGLLIFLCHFHFIFTMSLLMIRVFQTFQAGRLSRSGNQVIVPFREPGDWVVQCVSWPLGCRGQALQRLCRSS